MRRRSFDHLHAELSVEIGTLVPRYALWVSVREAGLDPDRLESGHLARFVDERLARFLAEEGLALPTRRLQRLRRRLVRFDPSVPTPYETMERIFSRPA